MAGVNKQIIVGNLGRDPELKTTQSGTPVCKFSVAVTEKYKDREETEWFNVTTFGPLAEICGEHLYKGKQVYIEGKTKTSKWEDKEGNKRESKEVIAFTMQMLGNPGTGSAGGSTRGNDKRPKDW